eukprot:2946362-Amphidinium_carterae.1
MQKRFTGALPDIRVDARPKAKYISSNTLSAGANRLEGRVPESLVGARKVKLHMNLFTSTLPGRVLHHERAEQFQFGNNMFSGTLPSSFSEHITMFQATNNKLAGAVPDGVGRMSKLKRFDVRWNFLIGALPGSFRTSMLEVLMAGENYLQGRLPDLDWKKLLVISMTGLELEGTIASSFTRMSSRKVPDHNHDDHWNVGQLLIVMLGRGLTGTVPPLTGS